MKISSKVVISLAIALTIFVGAFAHNKVSAETIPDDYSFIGKTFKLILNPNINEQEYSIAVNGYYTINNVNYNFNQLNSYYDSSWSNDYYMPYLYNYGYPYYEVHVGSNKLITRQNLTSEEDNDYVILNNTSISITFTSEVNNDRQELYSWLMDNSVTKTKLNTPSISLNGSIISWNSVSNASGYSITYTGNGSTSTFGNGTATSYVVSDVGNYQVTALAPGLSLSYENSSLSNIVYFGGSTSTRLVAPNVSFNSSNNRLTWYQVADASSYIIYFNGYQLDTTTSVHYDVNSSGTYQVQAISGNNNYGNSNLSNEVNVNTSVIDETTKPTQPSTSDSVIDWIKYFIELIDFYINTIFNGIVNLFQSSSNAISILTTYINKFVNSFGNLLAFLPNDLVTVISSLLIVSIMFAFIKFFRG